MKKKGAIEISFNWIFIMIAGAIILLFFISMVNTQKDKSRMNIALTVRSELNSIFTGASLSESRQLNVDIPKTSIIFTCDYSTCEDFSDSDSPSCYSNYEISDTGVSESTSSQVIFAPSEISGSRILTWALPWNIPFYVNNFLFVTGSNVKYFFLDGGDSFDFFNNFPESTNHELVDVEDLESALAEGNNNFKIVSFGVSPETLILSSGILSAAEDYNINAVHINPSIKMIDFYYLEDGFFSLDGSVYYSTTSEIFAAIYSDSLDFYRCNMQKAFNRFHVVSDMLVHRSRDMYDSAPDRCKLAFDPTQNGLVSLFDHSNVFSDENVLEVNSVLPSLSNTNHYNLERSCHLIY